MKKQIRLTSRILLTGIVATLVWYGGIALIFSPAQQVLGNPEYQSSKFLDVFIKMEPLPKMVVEPVSFFVGFLIVGITFSLAYHLIGRQLPGRSLRKGALFGFASWLLINPWFEFYLPWNVMHEPILLVLLEMGLWLIVLLVVGIVTVFAHHLLESKNI